MKKRICGVKVAFRIAGPPKIVGGFIPACSDQKKKISILRHSAYYAGHESHTASQTYVGKAKG